MPVLHSAQLWSSPPSIPHSLRCNVCINPPASTFVMKLAIFYGNCGNSNQKCAHRTSFMVDIFRFELQSNLRPKPPHIPHSRQNSILPCFINLPYFFHFQSNQDVCMIDKSCIPVYIFKTYVINYLHSLATQNSFVILTDRN